MKQITLSPKQCAAIAVGFVAAILAINAIFYF